MATLYRSIKKDSQKSNLFFDYKQTMRPPGHVPYIVDNLWEWARPDEFPCRRHASYASPTPKLALQSVPAGKVYQVILQGKSKIAQVIKYPDSKFHPDCNGLKKRMIGILNTHNDWWLNWDLDKKNKPAQIWMPCLRKSEIESLFEEIEVLKMIKDQIFSSITYWNDVKVIDPERDNITETEGEIFFEAFDGYRLVSI